MPPHLLVLFACLAIVMAGVRAPRVAEAAELPVIAAPTGPDGSREDDSGKPGEQCEESEEDDSEDLHLPTTFRPASPFSGHGSFLAPAPPAAKPRLVRLAALIRGPPAGGSGASRRI